MRQIGNEYLSVGIRIPEKVLNGTKNNPDIIPLRQLCVDGCPSSEAVNIREWVTNFSTGSSTQRAAYAVAQKACQEKSVTDFFYDSCVFDVLLTGEPLFSNMAHGVYEEVKKYASRQPRWRNRTQLEQYTRSLVERQQPVIGSGVSLAAQCLHGSVVRTLLFVYIMHIVSFYL